MNDALASLGTAALLLAAVTLPFFLFTGLGGVSFASPAGFALAGLAGPLLLLYLLKARRPRRRVGSLLFWRGVSLEQQANTPFRRLRRNLVLLLQLLALAALAYGLARPIVLADELIGGRSVVLVLDTSASMLAEDAGGRSRFETARAQARELIAGLGPTDQATLIACDRGARSLVPWTSQRERLEAALARLEPRHRGTALGEGLLLAASAAQAAERPPVVHLLSDGGGPPPPPLSLPQLRYHALGSSGENLGLGAIGLRPRRSAGAEGLAGEAQALAYEVFATVRNAGERERELFVGLVRGEQVLAARRLRVPAGAARPVVFEARLAPGPVELRLMPAEPGRLDLLAVDDRAYALVPAERGVPVGLVSEEPSPVLERGLQAAGGRLARIAPGEFRDDPHVRLYVFEGWVPERLPPRDVLILQPPRGLGPLTLGPARESPRIAGWDREDPLLRYVDLAGVDPAVARPLVLGGGARVLLQGEDPRSGESLVLIAAWEEAGARRVVVGFDPYRSAWPLRASFPIFLRNALLLASERDHLASGGVAAGTPVSIPTSTRATEVEVIDPQGQSRRVPAREGRALFADTQRVGVYRVRVDGREERFCVNLGDPDETRIAPRTRVELGDRGGAEASTRRPREVAAWFALAALLLLTLEAWVYHRRW